MSGRDWLFLGIIGLVLIAIAGLSELGEGNNQRVEEPAHSDPSANDPEPELAPIVGDVESARRSQPRRAATEREEGNETPEEGFWFGDTLAQWIMAFAALVATVVSIAVYDLLRRTLNATRSLVGQAEETSRSTNEAVTAAHETNRLARENMLSDRRPWVAIELAQVKPPYAVLKEGKLHVGFRLILTNIGKSPADHLFWTVIEIDYGLDHVEFFEMVKDWAHEDLEFGFPPERATVLMPNDKFVFGINHAVKIDVRALPDGGNLIRQNFAALVHYGSAAAPRQVFTTAKTMAVVVKKKAPFAVPEDTLEDCEISCSYPSENVVAT